MKLSAKTTTILFSISIICLIAYQLNSYFYNSYQNYESKWDVNWDVKLKKLDPVKSVNFLEYSKLSDNQIIFIEGFLQEEFKEFDSLIRARGLVQRLLDQYCYNVDRISCGKYLNIYLSKVSDYRLAGRYVNSLDKNSLVKSIKGAYIPDRFYFALDGVEKSSLKLENFSNDWKIYLTFLIQEFNPKIKFHFDEIGNIVILNAGVLIIPPALDVVVNLIKSAKLLQCDFDCKIETNKLNVTTGAKRISKTHHSMSKSKDIKIKVEDGAILQVLPWLGMHMELFNKTYTSIKV